jgi:hypothetical protein
MMSTNKIDHTRDHSHFVQKIIYWSDFKERCHSTRRDSLDFATDVGTAASGRGTRVSGIAFP